MDDDYVCFTIPSQLVAGKKIRAVEVEPGQHITITNDYWYSFEPENNGQYEINTCQSNCNTIIYVYQ